MERFLVFTYLDILLLVFVVSLFTIQLLYYLVTYMRPYRKMKLRENETFVSEKQPPVSVIVYAKNESYNLKKYLPFLLAQEYPVFEVIVINDGSTDESDEVLTIFENEYNNLYHTFIPQESKYLSRRKLALTVGIKAAKHHLLLFTEANCQPLSKNWITSMVRNYTDQTDIVLGFCAYKYEKGFFNQLVGYDNLITSLQYISSALKQNPFSGNGRNLSYRKELFFEHKGYSKSLSLHAGDDDLFVNESANSQNTVVEYSQESITEMAEITHFKVWKEMKVSRAATQHHYKGGQLTFYRLDKVTSILFLLVSITSLIVGIIGNPIVAITGLLLYALLFIAKAFVLNKASKMLSQKLSVALLPVLEIIQPVINLYVRIYRTFRGKKDYTFTLGGRK